MTDFLIYKDESLNSSTFSNKLTLPPTSIVVPPPGSLSYDASVPQLQFSDGISWIPVASGGSMGGYVATPSPTFNVLAGYTTGTGNTGTGLLAMGPSAGAHNSGNNVVAIGAGSGGGLSTGNSDSFLTAVGYNALSHNTTGTKNSAFGYQAGYSLTTGSDNTAIGFQALYSNGAGSTSTAVGYQALYSQTGTGANAQTAVGFGAGYGLTTGFNNTLIGAVSGYNLTTGDSNTCVGMDAMYSATTDGDCVAIGWQALFSLNLSGASSGNVAVGSQAGSGLTTGTQNIAIGYQALTTATADSKNVAIGYSALSNQQGALGPNTAVGYDVGRSMTSGYYNDLFGYQAGYSLTTGTENVALGDNAGVGMTTGSNNVLVGYSAGQAYTSNETSNVIIGSGVIGTAGESYVLRIGNGTGDSSPSQLNTAIISGIYGRPYGGTNSAVVIDNTGTLGTVVSSQRYKDDIMDMGEQSSALLKARPVTFTLKRDTTKTRQYGMIAEELAEIMPELVNLNDEGKPESIRYHDLPAMLLNELQKQQRRIEKLEALIERS